MKKINNCFNDIISPANLWQAWIKYRRGKRNRPAVAEFERNLENNLTEIKSELENNSYKHGSYHTFLVRDPKKRRISAPSIKDHLVHQAIYNILYPFFDKLFIPFSFSCRINRGLHSAINKFVIYLRKASFNYRKECWVLHGDIEKCFDSINHRLLFNLLKKRIECPRTLKLLKEIIQSYELGPKHGIPLGNLTSQLFINIYLDPLDRFVKENLKIKRYIRYGDDFLIICQNKLECLEAVKKIRFFLWTNLQLKFPKSHQRINKLSQGVETLGMRFLLEYYKMRSSTYRRVYKLFQKRLKEYINGDKNLFSLNASWQSFRGLLNYGHNYYFKKKLLHIVSNSL